VAARVSLLLVFRTSLLLVVVIASKKEKEKIRTEANEGLSSMFYLHRNKAVYFGDYGVKIVYNKLSPTSNV